MKQRHSDRHANDGRLVRRAQAGDETALTEIYQSNVQAIYRYVYNRTQDAAVAEDLTSEVFVRAVESLPRYRHRGAPLAAWLYRIARDRVVDYHRANGRHPTTELDEGLRDAAPGPEAAVFQQAEAARVQRALRQLTADQQDVIYFRITEGLSIEHTASLMGKTPGAVKALQFRALQSLGRLLK